MFKPSTFRAVPRGLRAPRIANAAPRRTFMRSRGSGPQERYDLNRLSQARNEYDRDRKYFLVAGVIAGVIGIGLTGTRLYHAIKAQDGKGGLQADSNTPIEQFTTEGGVKRKVVLHDEQGHEVVPTGNATVPEFPRILELAASAPPSDVDGHPQSIAATIQDKAGVEYTLVGLGLRTVTFLGFQVYVVGYYIATADIAKLQQHLVKKVNPIATTLVPSEREDLRAALLDPKEGEETWTTLMRDFKCRSAFRITPVRDTDFHHLRDAFVRAIQSRSSADKEAFGDDAFGQAVADLRQIFNRGKMPKQRELILCRDHDGALDVVYDDGKTGRQTIGRIEDERISRLLWLNYLAGKKVASEDARKNIIDGIMEFVERPVGTVATQVV